MIQQKIGVIKRIKPNLSKLIDEEKITAAMKNNLITDTEASGRVAEKFVSMRSICLLYTSPSPRDRS